MSSRPNAVKLPLSVGLIVLFALGILVFRMQNNEAARADTLELLRTGIALRIAAGLPVPDAGCQGRQCFDLQVHAPWTVRWDSAECRLTLREERWNGQHEDSVVISVERPAGQSADGVTCGRPFTP